MLITNTWILPFIFIFFQVAGGPFYSFLTMAFANAAPGAPSQAVPLAIATNAVSGVPPPAADEAPPPAAGGAPLQYLETRRLARFAITRVGMRQGGTRDEEGTMKSQMSLSRTITRMKEKHCKRKMKSRYVPAYEKCHVHMGVRCYRDGAPSPRPMEGKHSTARAAPPGRRTCEIRFKTTLIS